MFLVHIFFIWIFSLRGLEGSSSPDEQGNFLSESEQNEDFQSDNINNNLNLEREKEKVILNIEDFFKTANCEMKDYKVEPYKEAGLPDGDIQSGRGESLNRANQLKEAQEIPSCFINIRGIKDKEAAFKYLKDPQNWDKEKMHKSLYDKYHPFPNRHIERKGNEIIIYSQLQYRIQKILLKSIDKEDLECIDLGRSKIRKLEKSVKIPIGNFINQACFINLDGESFRSKSDLSKFYNTEHMNAILNEMDLKNRIIKSINETSGEKKQYKEDSSFIKAKVIDNKINIKIIESLNQEAILRVQFLKDFSALSCSALSQEEVDEFRETGLIAKDHFFIQGCNIFIHKNRMGTDKKLNIFFDKETLDKIFKETSFKKKFIQRVNQARNKQDLEELNIDSAVFTRITKDGIFGESKITILETSDNKEKAMKEELLKGAIEYSCHNLEKTEIDELEDGHIPRGQKFKKGCRVWIGSYRFEKEQDLFDFMDTKKIDQVFRENAFKKRFIQRVNQGRQKEGLERIDLDSEIFSQIEGIDLAEFYLTLFSTNPLP